MASALSGFNREQLGSTIEVLIALLDAADGDPDAEIEDPAGETVPVIDDSDGPEVECEGDPDLEETGAEDGFVTHPWDGPGCPVADPDCCPASDDAIVGEFDGEPGDNADREFTYAEWQTLPAADRRSGNFAGRAFEAFGRGLDDDVEDGDRDSCMAADDQGMAGGRWFERDSAPGNPEDAGDVATEDEPYGYMQIARGSGPGCEISDPGGCELAR